MHLLALASLVPLALAAPVIQPQGVQLIPGSYIVKLRDGASEATLQDAIRGGLGSAGAAKHIYRSSRFKGFAGQLSSAGLRKVQDLPDVSPLPSPLTLVPPRPQN